MLNTAGNNNSILSSLNYIYFFSISGLELPRRKNVCFVEKEEVGGLDVKATYFLEGKGERTNRALGVIRPAF